MASHGVGSMRLWRTPPQHQCKMGKVPVPTIYQRRCSRCSFASDIFPAEYGAVFVDQPASGGMNSVVAGAALFQDTGEEAIAEQGDPRLVVLAHPIEHHILAETGYTWPTLVWAGRYVRVRRVVCKSCGNLFEVRRLTSPPAIGCMVGLIVGLTVGIFYGVREGSFGSGFSAAGSITLGFYVVTGIVIWLYTRFRFKARAKEIDGPHNCPKCNSSAYVGVETRRTLPCPKCGESAMRVQSVGMS